MKKSKKLFLLLAFICLASTNLITSGKTYAEPYAVIINSANTYSADKRKVKQTLKKLFLRESGYWPNRVKAFPIARAGGSPEQAIFTSQILGLSDERLEFHWLKVKQRTGETAPVIATSTIKALKFVAAKKGGFAIVDLGKIDKLPKTIRVLMKFRQTKPNVAKRK